MKVPINNDLPPWYVGPPLSRPQPRRYFILRQLGESHGDQLHHWPSHEICRFETKEEAEEVLAELNEFRARTGLEFDSESSKYYGSYIYDCVQKS